MKRALLVVVSGSVATGRSNLAARLAAELGIPLVTRDAVRGGLVETQAGRSRLPAAELAARASDAWHDAVNGLLAADVSLVVEHSLRAEISRRDLDAFSAHARIRVVSCHLDPAKVGLPPPPEPVLRPMRTGGMIVERPQSRRPPGAGPNPTTDAGALASTLGVPVLGAHATAKGFKPPLAEIIWFCRQGD